MSAMAGEIIEFFNVHLNFQQMERLNLCLQSL